MLHSRKQRLSGWLITTQVVGLIATSGVGVMQGVSLIRSGIKLTESPSSIRASKEAMIQRMLNAGVIDQAKAREAIIHHATQQGINPSIGSRTEPADVRSAFDDNWVGSEQARMGTQLIKSGMIVICSTATLMFSVGGLLWFSHTRTKKQSSELRGEVMAT